MIKTNYVGDLRKKVKKIINFNNKIYTLTDNNNVFTADLSIGRNFFINNITTNQKTFVMTNIPNDLVQVTLDLTMTELANFVFTNITNSGWWFDGSAPIFSAGKRYTLWFETIDGGITWKCGIIGGFA